MSINSDAADYADVPCWTCRRRRLKCDRALPICDKCTCSQQPCLGYSKDKPLRWTDSVASRGKLTGKKVPRQEQHLPISRVLGDPGLRDLPSSIRGYIAYCKWGARVNERGLIEDQLSNSVARNACCMISSGQIRSRGSFD